eukprot:g12124.t1
MASSSVKQVNHELVDQSRRPHSHELLQVAAHVNAKIQRHFTLLKLMFFASALAPAAIRVSAMITLKHSELMMNFFSLKS